MRLTGGVAPYGAKTMMFIIKLKITQFFRKVYKSKIFFGLVALVIGITWTWTITFSSFEGANLMRFVRESVSLFASGVAEKIHPREIVFMNPALAAEKISPESVREEEAEMDPVKATIQRISNEEKIDWKLVYAVCLKESNCNPALDCDKQYGRCDDGFSFGAYQIYNPALDPERKRMAEDFEEATRWTIKHGYRFKDDPALFFKNHNGLYKTTNQWYVDGAMEKYKAL